VSRKRRASAHQKQIRFLTFFFGTILVAMAVGLIWLMSYFDRPGH
jgi:hypothetical protein